MTTQRINLGAWVVTQHLNRFGLVVQSFGYHRTQDMSFTGNAGLGYTVTANKEGDNAETIMRVSALSDLLDF